MAGQNRDYEILLKMRADMAAGLAALQKVQGELRKTSDAAASTSVASQKIGAALDGIGSRASAVGASLKKMAGALAAAFAVREIASFVQSVIDADAKLGDMSKKIGVSTETLSALGQVAKRNGSDVDALQGAFVKLAKGATDSSSASAKALQAMGIPLKQFLALKPADQFDLVAQKFSGYESGARKAALATALFGKAGADLIPTLNEVGQQGLQNLTDAAIANGTAVGGAAVDAAQKFQSALQTLKDKLQGAVNEGLAQFTPEIERVAQLFADPQFKAGIDGVTTAVVALAKILAEATSGLVAFIGNANRVFEFAQTGGAVYSPETRQLAQRRYDADIAELAHRGTNPNSFSEKSGRLRRATFTWSDSQSRAALKSTEDLLSDIAKTAAEIAGYDNSKKAPNAQDGDQRGLFAGLASKKVAPIVADAAGTGNDAAAKLARDAAAAQQKLTQSLIDLQGQLDPTAAIYAKYNAAVQQATDQAELAKKATGANAQAIDTQREAVIALAAKVRDAALDQLAEKDRQAWEALKRSFETPAQVAVDDALKRIKQLNDLLQKGTITAQEYHDALGQIGASSVTKAPQYQGLDATVGGIGSELRKNFDAQKDLEAWHTEQLKENERFRAQDAGNEEAYQARLVEIKKQYTDQQSKIEQARGQLQLSTAADIFGQLATLSSSHNKKIAAIGKAAAIAQTIIKTYQSATEAYAAMSGIPYIGPALGVAAAAAAIAAGLANVAQIRAQNVGGYSTGGYTGPGAVNQPAGVVHAGEVVFSQRDVARHGGVAAVESLRLRGYADGGAVLPDFSGAPSPADLGFQSHSMPSLDLAKLSAANESNAQAHPVPTPKVLVFFDKEAVMDELATTTRFEKASVHVVGNNPRAVQAQWGR